MSGMPERVPLSALLFLHESVSPWSSYQFPISALHSQRAHLICLSGAFLACFKGKLYLEDEAKPGGGGVPEPARYCCNELRVVPAQSKAA